MLASLGSATVEIWSDDLYVYWPMDEGLPDAPGCGRMQQQQLITAACTNTGAVGDVLMSLTECVEQFNTHLSVVCVGGGTRQRELKINCVHIYAMTSSLVFKTTSRRQRQCSVKSCTLEYRQGIKGLGRKSPCTPTESGQIWCNLRDSPRANFLVTSHIILDHIVKSLAIRCYWLCSV